MNLDTILCEGGNITSSGTTGPDKTIYRSPKNLAACIEVASQAQDITQSSKILTVTRMTHAGGLLLQTLPAHYVKADYTITKFNPYSFVNQLKEHSHTFLTPSMIESLVKTKDFHTADFTDKFISMGSDPIPAAHVNWFTERGATVLCNWGMSEVGPCAINKRFEPYEKCDSNNILGDKYWCDVEVVNNQIFVRGDICVYSGWFATRDAGYEDKGTLYYKGRIK
jgi:acyl-CoA synthetase (AMP-forming)/AMP-acid ligase II